MPEQATYLEISIGDWAQKLRKGDPLERRLSAHALAEIGQAVPESIAALNGALEDPASFVRVWAAAALARVTPECEQAIAALQTGMKDEIPFVRSLAAWHLGRLGPSFIGIETSVPKIRELLTDPDRSVRIEAVLALRNLEGHGAPPLELQSLGRDPSMLWETLFHG